VRDLATFHLVTDKLGSTLGCSRLLAQWIAAIDLDPSFLGTHSLRRIRATLIYCRTGNLRAVQLLLLGHTKIESTVYRRRLKHYLPTLEVPRAVDCPLVHGNSTVALNMPRYMRYEAAIQNRADGSGGFTWLMSRPQRRPCARAARRHRLLHRKDQSSAAQ